MITSIGVTKIHPAFLRQISSIPTAPTLRFDCYLFIQKPSLARMIVGILMLLLVSKNPAKILEENGYLLVCNYGYPAVCGFKRLARSTRLLPKLDCSF